MAAAMRKASAEPASARGASEAADEVGCWNINGQSELYLALRMCLEKKRTLERESAPATTMAADEAQRRVEAKVEVGSIQVIMVTGC